MTQAYNSINIYSPIINRFSLRIVKEPRGKVGYRWVRWFVQYYLLVSVRPWSEPDTAILTIVWPPCEIRLTSQRESHRKQTYYVSPGVVNVTVLERIVATAWITVSSAQYFVKTDMKFIVNIWMVLNGRFEFSHSRTTNDYVRGPNTVTFCVYRGDITKFSFIPSKTGIVPGL